LQQLQNKLQKKQQKTTTTTTTTTITTKQQLEQLQQLQQKTNQQQKQQKHQKNKQNIHLDTDTGIMPTPSPPSIITTILFGENRVKNKIGIFYRQRTTKQTSLFGFSFFPFCFTRPFFRSTFRSRTFYLFL
jgi:7-keto-8-aminopelargonate synthetase-like enzyme